MRRRVEFARLIPQLVWLNRGRSVTLAEMYRALEMRRPDLVDIEPDPHAPHRPKWQHDFRWELQTAVTAGRVSKLSELGRGHYGPPVSGGDQVTAGPGIPARLAPLEQMRVYGADVATPATVRRLVRAEAMLVARYEEWLLGRDLPLTRFEFRTPEGEQLWADAFDERRRLLIEAKSLVSRPAIRMAVGQLLDYRFALEDDVALAILLPARPSASLCRFVWTCEIGVIVELQDGGFDERLIAATPHPLVRRGKNIVSRRERSGSALLPRS